MLPRCFAAEVRPALQRGGGEQNKGSLRCTSASDHDILNDLNKSKELMRFFSGVDAAGSKNGDGAAALARYVGLHRVSGQLRLDVNRCPLLHGCTDSELQARCDRAEELHRVALSKTQLHAAAAAHAQAMCSMSSAQLQLAVTQNVALLEGWQGETAANGVLTLERDRAKTLLAESVQELNFISIEDDLQQRRLKLAQLLQCNFRSVATYHTILYHTMPYHTIPYHATAYPPIRLYLSRPFPSRSTPSRSRKRSEYAKREMKRLNALLKVTEVWDAGFRKVMRGAVPPEQKGLRTLWECQWRCLRNKSHTCRWHPTILAWCAPVQYCTLLYSPVLYYTLLYSTVLCVHRCYRVWNQDRKAYEQMAFDGVIQLPSPSNIAKYAAKEQDGPGGNAARYQGLKEATKDFSAAKKRVCVKFDEVRATDRIAVCCATTSLSSTVQYFTAP